MTTILHPRPLDQYYPGVAIRSGRIVRLGRYTGIELDREMERFAREVSLSVDQLHEAVIICMQQGGSEALMVILTSPDTPSLASDAPRRS
jgi:hypothetical protein